MIPQETKRLHFRYFRNSDFSLVKVLNSNPLVTTYVGGAKSDQEIELSMEKYLNYHLQHPGYGYWFTRLKGSNQFIGYFLVKTLVETGETEIGYRLHPDYWGQGLATEGATALLNYCFDKLGKDRVVAVAHPDNMASRRVLEKSGLRFKEYGKYYQVRCAYYSLSRDQWRQH